MEDLGEAFLREELFVQVPLGVYPQDKVKMPFCSVKGHEFRLRICELAPLAVMVVFLESFGF